MPARIKMTAREAKALESQVLGLTPRKGRKPLRQRTERELEKSFLRRVMDLAKVCGWRRVHFRTVKVQRPGGGVYHATPFDGDAGFPDLVLVRCSLLPSITPRLIFMELKRKGEVPTPDQELWAADLRAAGQEVYTFWPKDWEEIERVLA